MIKYSDINLISEAIKTEESSLNATLDTQISLNKQILSVIKNFFVSVDISIPTTQNPSAYRYITDLKESLSMSDNNIEKINFLINNLKKISKDNLDSVPLEKLENEIFEYNTEFSSKMEILFENTTKIETFIRTISLLEKETLKPSSLFENSNQNSFEPIEKKKKKNKKSRKEEKRNKIKEKNKKKNINKKTIMVPTDKNENNNIDIQPTQIEKTLENNDLPVNELSENSENNESNINVNISNETVEEETIQENNLDTIEEISVKNDKYQENLLLISEMQEKVFLPYKLTDISQLLMDNREKYNSIDDVINDVYTVPYERYRFAAISRFKEAYALVKNNNGSTLQAISLGAELFSNFNLHPAIITSCKTLDELDIYLACLEDDVLNEFDIFDIKFEIRPIVNNKKPV